MRAALRLALACCAVLAAAAPAARPAYAVGGANGADARSATDGWATYRALVADGAVQAAAGRYGRAALSWERARLVYDGDGRLARDLAIVRARSGADKLMPEADGLAEALAAPFARVPRAWLLVVAVAGGTLLLLLLAAGTWRRWTGRRLYRALVWAVAGLAAAAAVTLAFRAAAAHDAARCVVVGADAPLFAGPAADAAALGVLPAALELKVSGADGRRVRDGRVRVILPGGAQGWTDEHAVERIVQ